ncbi:MAG: DUF4160 domain-containing protein [Deltaproteobacteria bacterium]|nr:DUF4160 domain-containing protein [Deltaproteobacteria bacterium]
MIRTNDHPPPHVHAMKGNCSAVIEILTGRVVRSHGFSRKDVGQIGKAVLSMKSFLLEEWNAIHEEKE